MINDRYLAEKYLDDAIATRKHYRAIPEKELFAMDDAFFLKYLYAFFTPQSYGTKVEKRIRENNNFRKIKAKEDRGDVVYHQWHGEIKCSFKNHDNKYSFVQLRLYQECDFYYLMCIDSDTFKTYTFVIPKSDIKDVIDYCDGGNCHGVLKNKTSLDRIEYRFSVEQGSKKWDYLTHYQLNEPFSEYYKRVTGITSPPV